MCQIIILVFGSLAIALIAQKSERVQFWGFVSGAISEPFWIYEAYNTRQWGVVLLALYWGGFYVWGAWRRRHAGYLRGT
jgi:hypothetical protein